MNGPAKNRLHDYEAGWLTLLIQMGVATQQDAHDAMGRITQEAIDDIESKRGRRQAARLPTSAYAPLSTTHSPAA